MVLPENDVIPKILGENSDVDTVIFDIGKVLVKYDWKKLLKELKYDEDTAQAVSEAVFLSEDWTESDRGVRTEEEILQSFITNNPSYEKEIRETFARMGETISVCSYTKDWLSYLKKRGYKLYFLSNFSEPLYKRCTKDLTFLEFMDGGYMSWQVHLLKPEPEMYQKLIQDFQIVPEKAVYIDDYMDNVAEARAQGLNAIHFTGRKSAVQQLMDFSEIIFYVHNCIRKEQQSESYIFRFTLLSLFFFLLCQTLRHSQLMDSSRWDKSLEAMVRKMHRTKIPILNKNGSAGCKSNIQPTRLPKGAEMPIIRTLYSA